MNQAVLRILLAEDNDGDVFLVRRALERNGVAHELILASNGEEALRLIERTDVASPDLILLDLNLPRFDGEQILSRIRVMQALNDTPVIVLTSSDSAQDRERALGLGARMFFRKPSDLQAFMNLGRVIRDLFAESTDPQARKVASQL